MAAGVWFTLGRCPLVTCLHIRLGRTVGCIARPCHLWTCSRPLTAGLDEARAMGCASPSWSFRASRLEELVLIWLPVLPVIGGGGPSSLGGKKKPNTNSEQVRVWPPWRWAGTLGRKSHTPDLLCVCSLTPAGQGASIVSSAALTATRGCCVPFSTAGPSTAARVLLRSFHHVRPVLLHLLITGGALYALAERHSVSLRLNVAGEEPVPATGRGAEKCNSRIASADTRGWLRCVSYSDIRYQDGCRRIGQSGSEASPPRSDVPTGPGRCVCAVDRSREVGVPAIRSGGPGRMPTIRAT